MRFVDLFAGTGGFHYALRGLGHECVFASEKDDELRSLYITNFPEMAQLTWGDITEYKHKVPAHEILCAGFPCQPFSKSGAQRGLNDVTRGTLFHEIVEILRRRMPPYVILENVGNFERHDDGRTWGIVREQLESLGYSVKGTEHISSGGHGLISPHHFGYPHHRERFFIVAALHPLPEDPFPRGRRDCTTRLADIVLPSGELTETEVVETRLTAQQIACIEHWNAFLTSIPGDTMLPSFPIWGDELDTDYPFQLTTPYLEIMQENPSIDPDQLEDRLLAYPRYARTKTDAFPGWKVSFIRQNRDFWTEVHRHLSDAWKTDLRKFPPSLRKLEWNCQGEERNLWHHVLQYRPSGLRAKRYSASPALVAMTTTQIPILGPEHRFLSRREGLRLQNLPDGHALPRSHAAAFAALGNGVHVSVVRSIAERLFSFGAQAYGEAEELAA